MKKYIWILGFLFLPFLMFAQVKNYICEVREVYSEKVTNQLKDLGKYFQQTGERDFAVRMEEFLAEDNYGTGFVYVRSDGKNFVITNRHLVQFGESVTVSFYAEDGTVSEYVDLKVVAMNEQLDLAVLAFPNDIRPFKKGLNLYSGLVENGTKIVAAGFNDTGDRNSWKLVSGVVSNNSATIKELASPEVSTFIQHTVQLNAGLSGGPLLVRNKDKSYSVVGINTWQTEKRMNTNVAIPVSVIEEFVEDVNDDPESENPGEEVYARAIKFGTFMGNYTTNYQQLVPHISTQFIADYGKQIFVDTQRRCTKDIWETITNVYMDGTPLEGLQYAIAWQVFEIYHRNDRNYSKQKKSDDSRAKKVIPVSIQPPDNYKDTEDWYVIYNLPAKGAHAFSRWIYEYGTWQLRNFIRGSGEFAVKDKDLSHMGKVKLYQPNLIVVSNGITGNVPYDKTLFSQYLDVEVKIKNWLSIETTGKLVNSQIPVMRSGEDILMARFKQGEIQCGAQFNMPFYLQSIILMPYGSTKLGVQLEDVDMKTAVDLSFDVDGALRSTLFLKEIGLTFFVDTGCSFILDSILVPNADGKRWTPNFNFFVGLGFGI